MQELLILSCLTAFMGLSASLLSHANVIRIKRPIHAKLGVMNKYLNHEQYITFDIDWTQWNLYNELYINHATFLNPN